MISSIMISFLACTGSNLDLCSTVIFTEKYTLGKEETVEMFCITRAPFEAKRFLDTYIGYKADDYYIPMVSCETIE